MCLCVCVLCKPHYLYHYIDFLSLSLSEIIEHLEKHQSVTQTQTPTNVLAENTLDLNTHTHTHPDEQPLQEGKHSIAFGVDLRPALNGEKSGTLSQKMFE